MTAGVDRSRMNAAAWAGNGSEFFRGSMNTMRHSSRLAQAMAAAWFSYVAVDFLTHAVVLAPWWRATESFWLPPMQLLRMVPFGYLSFALYAIGLVWLMPRLIGDRPRFPQAAAYAAAVGLLVGLSQALANYSVFPMPASALVVWPLSVILGSIGAGLAAASVLRAHRPSRRLLVIVLIALAVIIIGVVFQNLLFPTPADRLARSQTAPSSVSGHRTAPDGRVQ